MTCLYFYFYDSMASISNESKRVQLTSENKSFETTTDIVKNLVKETLIMSNISRRIRERFQSSKDTNPVEHGHSLWW